MRRFVQRVLGPTALALVLAAIVSPTARAGLVINGSFEAVQITTEFSSNPADIPSWTHTGNPGDALLWRAGPQCCGGTNTAKAGNGNQFVTMGGGFDSIGSAAWSQVINGLTVGQTYDVDFMIASEGETSTQNVTVGFTTGSPTGPQTFTSIPTSTLFWQNWGSEQYSFVAGAASATLQFSVTNQRYDVGLDDVSIVPALSSVPEPGSLFPLGATLLLGLFAAKRNRSRHTC